MQHNLQMLRIGLAEVEAFKAAANTALEAFTKRAMALFDRLESSSEKGAQVIDKEREVAIQVIQKQLNIALEKLRIEEKDPFDRPE